MPSISSGVTPSPAIQQGFSQLKIQQAKRNAEQAEASARALQAQAADAQLRASQAQENARDLSVRANQADLNAGQARQGLEAIRSLSQTSTDLKTTYERIASVMQADTTEAPVAASTTSSAAPLSAPVSTATSNTSADTAGSTGSLTPTINSQGETTGTNINITA